MKIAINSNSLELLMGDITEQTTEAIVNAANGTLLGGGGVDGAIHQAAGLELLAECKRIRETDLKGEFLPTGEAVVTNGYHLPAAFVIHTVGPIWSGGVNNEEERLANSYQHCLQLAHNKQLHSLSFPSISTGVYHFPIERAAKIALNTIISFLLTVEFGKVVMVLFSEHDYQIYTAVLKRILIEGKEHADTLFTTFHIVRTKD